MRPASSRLPQQPRWRRGFDWIGLALVVMLALYLIGRAVVEVVTVNPHRPETYRQNWGGPSYLGVLAIHAGPGLVVATLAILYGRHRRRLHRGQSRDPRTPTTHPWSC